MVFFACIWAPGRAPETQSAQDTPTTPFKGKASGDVPESQSREHAQGEEVCPSRKNAETAYSLPVTPGTHDPQTSISKKKKWKCIHCTGGQRSTVKMWTGPYPLLKLRGRTSSSSGFGETSSAWRVTTSLQPMSSIALRSTLNVSPHC